MHPEGGPYGQTALPAAPSHWPGGSDARQIHFSVKILKIQLIPLKILIWRWHLWAVLCSWRLSSVSTVKGNRTLDQDSSPDSKTSLFLETLSFYGKHSAERRV